VLSGEATNREPGKTRQVRWFSLDELPANLTDDRLQRQQRIDSPTFQRFRARVVATDFPILGAAERRRPLML
jgi:hypothetical protein